MKFVLSIFIVFIILKHSIAQDLNLNKEKETQHFILKWNTQETSSDEIDEALHFIEKVYNQERALFGDENMPARKIEVRLNGEGLIDGGKKANIPRVDGSGIMYLYRFPGGGYLEPFPHELVHAIRINNIPSWEPFFEEGLASSISSYLYPKKEGFPFFGYEQIKIASYLAIRDDYMPLIYLRTHHRIVNFQCQLQSYILREDFFTYLIQQYGIKKLISFANSDEVGHLDTYKKIWNKSFSELANEWRKQLVEKYPKSEIMTYGEEFLTKTPAKYQRICKPN